MGRSKRCNSQIFGEVKMCKVGLPEYVAFGISIVTIASMIFLIYLVIAS